MNLTYFSVTARKAAQWDTIESELLTLKDIPETFITNNGKVYKISHASPDDVERIARNMQKLVVRDRT